MVSHLTSLAQAVRVKPFPPLLYIDLPATKEAWDGLSQSGKARLTDAKAKVAAARRRMKDRAAQPIGDAETTSACPSTSNSSNSEVSLDPSESIIFQAQDDVIFQQPQVQEEIDTPTVLNTTNVSGDLKKELVIDLHKPEVVKENENLVLPDTPDVRSPIDLYKPEVVKENENLVIPDTPDLSSPHVHTSQSLNDGGKEEDFNDTFLRILSEQNPRVKLLVDPVPGSSSWGESTKMMEPLLCFVVGALVAHWFFTRPSYSKYQSNGIVVNHTLGDPQADATASSALQKVNERMASFEQRLALLEANQKIAQLQEQLRASNIQQKQQQQGLNSTPASERIRPHRIQWDVNMESPTSTTASAEEDEQPQQQLNSTPLAALSEKMRPDQIIQWDTNAESPTSTVGSTAAEEARASLQNQHQQEQLLKSTPTAAMPKKINPHGSQWDKNVESPTSTMASADEEALLNEMMLSSNANQRTLGSVEEEALLNDMMLASDPSQRTDDSSVASDASGDSDVNALLQDFQTELKTIQENIRTGNFQ